MTKGTAARSEPTRDVTVKKIERTNTHVRYVTSDGGRVPGGSTLARVVAFGSPDNLIKWGIRCHEEGKDFNAVRQESAHLGNCFHRTVETRHKGERFPAELYPPIFVEQAARMADSFFGELMRLGLVIVESELQYVSDDLRAGGTMDLILADEKTPVIPEILGDLKSSTFLSGEHVLQVAGFYREMFREKYGAYPTKVILFRADRDSGLCRVTEIPADVVEAAEKAVRLVRPLYDLRRTLERRLH